MRKTTMLGLSTIALCLGVLIGAVGNSSHGRSVIKAAHADTKGGGGGSNKCPDGSLPHCASCDSDNNCAAACSGSASCSVWYGSPINVRYCSVSKSVCMSGTTQIGGGDGGGSGPVLTIGR